MDLNNLPLVSVIIPAYNHERFIQNTIVSIIKQTYENIELVVIDDGSTDSTFEKIKELEQTCSKRFKKTIFKKQDNAGTCETLNRLLDLSSGEYIYFIASDDIAKENAISILHHFLSNNKDYALAVGNNELIDENGDIVFWDDKQKTIKNKDEDAYLTFVDFYKYFRKDVDFTTDSFGSYVTLLKGNYIPNGYLIKKDIFEKTGTFKKDAPLEDYYLMLQISKYYKMKYIDKILFQYRQHSSNTKNNRDHMIAITNKTLEHEYVNSTEKYQDIFEKVISSKKEIFSIFNIFNIYKTKSLYSKKVYIKIFGKVFLLKNCELK